MHTHNFSNIDLTHNLEIGDGNFIIVSVRRWLTVGTVIIETSNDIMQLRCRQHTVINNFSSKYIDTYEMRYLINKNNK